MLDKLNLIVEKSDNGFDMYDLDKLKEIFTVEELIPGELWVAYNISDGFWVRFAFFDFLRSRGGDKEVKVGIFWHGDGPSGALRECRHSFFGAESDNPGYVFYVNRANFNAAFEWLSKYFDLD